MELNYECIQTVDVILFVDCHKHKDHQKQQLHTFVITSNYKFALVFFYTLQFIFQ